MNEATTPVGAPHSRPALRFLPVLAVVALLGAAMVGAVFGDPAIEVLPLGQRTAPAEAANRTDGSQASDAQDPAPEPESRAPGGLPGGVLAGVLGLFGILGAGGLVLAIRLGRSRRRGVEPGWQTTPRATRGSRDHGANEALRALIDDGLADLDETDADPRRAVIACWVRLERAAADAGTTREPGDTSTDLVARMLTAHKVSSDQLATLAALYRQARFGARPVPAPTRDLARAALRRIRDELGPPPGRAYGVANGVASRMPGPRSGVAE